MVRSRGLRRDRFNRTSVRLKPGTQREFREYARGLQPHKRSSETSDVPWVIDSGQASTAQAFV